MKNALKREMQSIFNTRKLLIKKGYSKLSDEKEILIKIGDIENELKKADYLANQINIANKHKDFIIHIIANNDNWIKTLESFLNSIENAKLELAKRRNLE